VNIPADRKAHWLQPAVGHYGVFNGSRFRAEIVPRISDFVLSNNTRGPRSIRRSPAAAVAAEPGMTYGSQPLSRASPGSHMSTEPPATVTR